MKSLGFLTIAVGAKYEKFVAPYITSTQLSYPGSTVEILVNDSEEFTKNNAAQVDGLRQHFDGCFWISTIPSHLRNLQPGAARFVTQPLGMPMPEILYIGDVDILILTDPPTIDKHVDYMNKLGLPYSNRTREGVPRLTGLHVVRTADYFKKLQPGVLAEAASSLRKITDERLLYELMKDNFGIPKVSVPRPIHGIHMSPSRPMLPGDGDSFEDLCHWGIHNGDEQHEEHNNRQAAYKEMTKEPVWKHMLSLFTKEYRHKIEELDLLLDMGYEKYKRDRGRGPVG